VIKKVKGGYQLHSRKDPTRALGPVRASESEVTEKDERRVQHFQKLKNSSKAPASSDKRKDPTKYKSKATYKVPK
jgi:hypothetical protein